MPTVKGKRFPYTAKGAARAKTYARKNGAKMQPERAEEALEYGRSSRKGC